MKIPPMWGYISLVNKYIYAENPKACCSTIKGRLFSLEATRTPIVASRVKEIVESTTPGRLHNPMLGPLIRAYQLPDDMLQEIVASPHFFRFSFVRDPYSRVLSAYLDKIENKAPPWQSMVKAGFPVNRDFPSFIRLLSKDKRALLYDKHWKPQHVNLLTDRVNYDFIGKFEHFEHDFEHVWRIISSAQRECEDIRIHRTAADDKLKQYYNEEAAMLVADTYRKDFEAFGYPREPAFLA